MEPNSTGRELVQPKRVKSLNKIQTSRFFQVPAAIVVQTLKTCATSECFAAIYFQGPLISVPCTSLKLE